MKLFLTSSPCSPAPEGSGLAFQYNPAWGFVDALTEALDGVPRHGGLMVAAWPEDHARNDRMAEEFLAALRWHRMAVDSLRMIDSRSARELPGLLEKAGFVLLAGGHVPTQNAFFRQLGLKELLRGFDGVVMGISAGSMNCAEEVYAQPELPGEAADPAYCRFLPGLGLTRVQVLPHINEVWDSTVDGLRLFDEISIPDSRGHVFYAIPDGSYVLAEGRTVIHGPYRALCDGAAVHHDDSEEAVLTV